VVLIVNLVAILVVAVAIGFVRACTLTHVLCFRLHLVALVEAGDPLADSASLAVTDGSLAIRLQLKKEFPDSDLSPFPAKHLFALSPADVLARQDGLETFLQRVRVHACELSALRMQGCAAQQRVQRCSPICVCSVGRPSAAFRTIRLSVRVPRFGVQLLGIATHQLFLELPRTGCCARWATSAAFWNKHPRHLPLLMTRQHLAKWCLFVCLFVPFYRRRSRRSTKW
jgi:hypothetical protein